MCPKVFQNFLINFAKQKKKIKNTGILCNLCKSRKSIRLSLLLSVKENLLGQVRLSLTFLRLVLPGLQCAKSLIKVHKHISSIKN